MLLKQFKDHELDYIMYELANILRPDSLDDLGKVKPFKWARNHKSQHYTFVTVFSRTSDPPNHEIGVICLHLKKHANNLYAQIECVDWMSNAPNTIEFGIYLSIKELADKIRDQIKIIMENAKKEHDGCESIHLSDVILV